MNHTKISKILLALFAVVLCYGPGAPGVGLAEPVGTAFTYQGRLIDNNQPADGLYDLQFKMFDASSDGNQLGLDVNLPEVDVIDGYFTVELDLGSVFDGNNRWLDIGVRPGDQNDPNVYTTLSPRQEVTPAPHAIYADSSNWNNLIDIPPDIADGDNDTHLTETEVDAMVENNGYLKTEVDPIFTASSASAIQGTDINNWNTAYSWGDHSIAGYLTGYTETDPIFTASPASAIQGTDINNWNTAYGWGDHNLAGYLTSIPDSVMFEGENVGLLNNDAGYLTSYSETDPIFATTPASAIQGVDINNWNAAYGWGDHNLAGYLKSYTEVDPIFIASSASTIQGTDITNWNTAYSWGDHSIEGYLKSIPDSVMFEGENVSLLNNDAGYLTGYTETDPIFIASPASAIQGTDISHWNTAYGWGDHSIAGYLTMLTLLANDGTGSTLDADYLDGYHSSNFLFASGTAVNSDKLDGSHASAFVTPSTDYGRLNVSSNLYEGPNTLTSKYVNQDGPDTMTGSTSGSVLTVTNSGSGRSIYGNSSSTSAVTNYAGYFTAAGQTGRAVYGEATNTGSYLNYGGYFVAQGSLGTAVYGYAPGTTGWGVEGEGADVGVYGKATGTFGQGVHAYATGSFGDGVYAYANGADGYAVNCTSVYSDGLHSSGGRYAGYFDGHVYVDGNQVVTGTKSFVQPHPTDASKEIVYVCLEGGENGVYVRGSGQLNNGRATIKLPEHFSLVAAKRGITTQVTSTDGKAKAYLWVERVSPEQIVVVEAGNGTSDASFDYLVMGVRTGFENHEAIQENAHFKPDGKTSQTKYEQRFGPNRNNSMRQLLINNGTLTVEGKVNEVTASRLGWTFGPESVQDYRKIKDKETLVGEPSPGFEKGESGVTYETE